MIRSYWRKSFRMSNARWTHQTALARVAAAPVAAAGFLIECSLSSADNVAMIEVAVDASRLRRIRSHVTMFSIS